MSLSILCHGCGKRFDLPEGFQRRKKQCPFCGVMCEVPASAAAETAAPPPRPAATPSPSPARVETKPAERTPRTPEAAPVPAPRPLAADAPLPLADDPTPPAPLADPSAPMTVVPCPQCSHPVEVPAGVRAEVRCPRCAMLVAEPSPFAAVGMRTARSPRRRDDDVDSDGNPYAVVDTGERRCPECGNLMAREDVVCLECGYNRQTGQKPPKRSYDKVEREWEAGLSLWRRLLLFAGLQGVYVIFGVILVHLTDSPGMVISTWICFTLMLAFVLGTYDRINLSRNKRGQVRLTKSWRAFFIPWQTETVAWREYQGVVVGMGYDAGILEWLVLLNLLIVGLVPGIVWFFLMNRDSYFTSLTREHGFPALTLYRGWNQQQAEDLARTIHEVTGLPYEGN